MDQEQDWISPVIGFDLHFGTDRQRERKSEGTNLHFADPTLLAPNSSADDTFVKPIKVLVPIWASFPVASFCLGQTNKDEA